MQNVTTLDLPELDRMAYGVPTREARIPVQFVTDREVALDARKEA